jgi:cytochrome o ubiquinol oxidase subunit 1
MKEAARTTPSPTEPTHWEPIHMPRNSAVGFFLSFFSVVAGFALVWHIWWLAIVGVLGMAASGLVHAWRVDAEVEITSEEIAAAERGRPRATA